MASNQYLRLKFSCVKTSSFTKNYTLKISNSKRLNIFLTLLKVLDTSVIADQYLDINAWQVTTIGPIKMQ